MIDMSKIKFIQSPNCYPSRGDHKIEYIVIHAMDGSYQGTIAWHSNKASKVSANYLISRQGEVTQMVKDEQAAWHVVDANRFCLGIEHEDTWKDPLGRPVGGYFNNIPWWTQPELDTSAQIVAQLLVKYNLPISHVIGHNDPYLVRFRNDHKDPGHLFPWSGYRQLVQQYLDELTVKPQPSGLLTGHSVAVSTGDSLSLTESPVEKEPDFQADTQQLFKPKSKKNKRYGLS